MCGMLANGWPELYLDDEKVCVCVFFFCFFQSYFHTIAGMFLFRQLFDLLKGMKANQTEFVNWNVDSVLCGISRELITA